LLLGFMPRVGLSLIILFLVPVTLIMHNFWAVPDQARMAETTNFLKNTGLLGACFAMMALPVPWPGSIMARRQQVRAAEPKTDWLTGRRIPH
jgi:putative oxidoreductase